MKSESKKFKSEKSDGGQFMELKPVKKKWLISYERWQYIGVNQCVEKRSVKIEDITLEKAIDQINGNYDINVRDSANKIFFVNITEL